MKLAYLVVGVFVIWILTWVGVMTFVPGDATDWGRRGQFGDLFGAATSLFSGLAFAGLFWSLRVQQAQLELQRNELGLQREELKLQREEMAASRAELANQVRAQYALFQASAAQISVAATQAQIEAIRIRAEGQSGPSRAVYASQIDALGSALFELSNRIEGMGQPLT